MTGDNGRTMNGEKTRADRAAAGEGGKPRRTARKRGVALPAIDRREAILRAATRRFAEFGFEATTVRQIADDVNILSGSLYHHFTTKEEMLDLIVRDAVLAMRDDSLRIAALPLDAETRLVALIEAELRRLTLRQEVYAIAFNERKLFRRSPDFQYLSAAKKDAYDAWRAVLQQGVEAGLFHPGIDPYLTISTIVRMLNTGADWYKNEDGSPLDAMANYTLDQLLDFYLGFILRTVRAPTRIGDPIVRAQ